MEVLSLDEAETCRERLAAAEARYGAGIRSYLRDNPHYVFPFLYDLVCHPAVLDAVEDAIGPDILAWGSGFFTKDAGDQRIVSWHQDARYWGLEPPIGVSAWIPFSPSTPESGCMRFVPGTHRSATCHPSTSKGTSYPPLAQVRNSPRNRGNSTPGVV